MQQGPQPTLGPRKPRCPTSPFSPRAPAMPSRPGWPYGKRTAWFGTYPCPSQHGSGIGTRLLTGSPGSPGAPTSPWRTQSPGSGHGDGAPSPPSILPSGFPALSLPSAHRGRVPRGIPWSPSRPARPSPPASRNVGHGDADVPGSPQPCVSPCPPQPRTFSPGVPCSPLSPLSPSEPFGPRSPCRGGGRGMGSGRSQDGGDTVPPPALTGSPLLPRAPAGPSTTTVSPWERFGVSRVGARPRCAPPPPHPPHPNLRVSPCLLWAPWPRRLPAGTGGRDVMKMGGGSTSLGGFPPPPSSPDPLPCPHVPLGPPASPVGQRRGFFFGGRDTQLGGQRAVGTYRRPAVACQPRAPVFTLWGGEKGV